jgi:hypothetical protein
VNELYLKWKVHLPNLLDDIIPNLNRKGYEQVLAAPMVIFKQILKELAELAIEIDDPRLSLMMCRLTLFSASDPTDPDYDKDIFNKLVAEIKEMK